MRESSELSLTELGNGVNRQIVPLERAAQRLMERATDDARLMLRIDEIGNELLESQKV